MTRAEAYWILERMLKETFSAQEAEALIVAQDNIQFVDLMPGDAVPVVRCKDCKRCNGFHDPNDIQPNEIGICKVNMMAVKPDDYCSYGERRIDNE